MARVRSFKKTQVKDSETSKLQSNLEVFFKPIINSEIIDGVLLKNVCLEAGVRNEVEHKLGRKPIGFMIVRKRADSRIWDLQDSNPGPLRSFTLACSHDVEVDVWIF